MSPGQTLEKTYKEIEHGYLPDLRGFFKSSAIP